MAIEIDGALMFTRRVRSYGPDLWNQYRRVMGGFVSGELDASAVAAKLESLFKPHEDLLHRYTMFLPPQLRHSFSPPQFSRKRSASAVAPDMKKLSPCIEFINKLEKRFGDERAVIRGYLEAIRGFTKGKLSANEVYDTVAKLFGDENQDLVDDFESILGEGGRKKIKRTEEDDKLSSSPASSTSSRSEERKRSRKRNRGDDMEDEMFVVDVKLSCVRDTLKSGKKLKNILMMSDSSTQQQQQIIMDSDQYFRVMGLGCIKEIYKEQGLWIIKKLRQDPKHVLPQILSHLESKEKELVESKDKIINKFRSHRNRS